MQRRLKFGLAVALIGTMVSVVAASILYARFNARLAEIEPIKVNRPLKEFCAETKTTEDFQEFWQQFSDAVRVQNRDKLFSLTSTCAFTWDDYPTLPLRITDCVLDPVNDCYGSRQPAGQRYLFEGQDDFEKNYNRIFTESIRDKISRLKPWRIDEAHYAIGWNVDNRSSVYLRFDRSLCGFKFAGLTWEPQTIDGLN